MEFLKKLKEWQFSLFFLSTTIVSAVFILFWKYNTPEIANLGVFFVKLAPYLLAVFAIAFCPRDWFKPPKDILMILLAFGIMFCFFVPRLFFYYWHPDPTGAKFYLLMQMLVPFVILALLFTYKMGGGNKREVIVLGMTSILFMLSGIEDLAYMLGAIQLGVIKTLPEKWDWAHHINVFIGHAASKNEVFTFIGIHFVIIIAILYFVYGHRKLINAIKKRTESQ